MYIHEIISYKGSWNTCNNNYSRELNEIMDALADFLNGRITIEGGENQHSRRLWEKALFDRGWEIIERTHYSQDGRRVSISPIGPTKNGVNAQFQLGFSDSLGRWLFQQSALAIRHNLICMPILLAPVREYNRRIESKIMSRMSFEMYQDQLLMLSPLTFSYPFLIIGYSDQATSCPPNVVEIEEDLHSDTSNHIVDRCIEFPPEYHQAGLGILNYFGSYLREQYPNEEATVKIEQQGLKVRLVITTEGGRTETIEKALHEYELIVTGQEPPEKFTQNDKLVLELKNELRVAQFRIEAKQDIISLQNVQIDKLLTIVGDGLSNRQAITIDFKPSIIATSNVQVNHDISLALGGLGELMELLPRSSDAYLALSELENSLESIENENNPETIRNSSAMNKFKKVLEKFREEGSTLKKALDATEAGWELFKDIAGKYNKVAEWCGLPQIPSTFT
jgi:hypothetical protein